MRVRCKQVDIDGKRVDSGSNPYFTVDKDYLVLGLSHSPGREPAFWVETDVPLTPVFKGISFFEVSDGRLPEKWVAVSLPGGGLNIWPREFIHGFRLEDFFDRKQEAVALFQKVISELRK